MSSFGLRKFAVFLLFLALLPLTGCELNDEEKAALNDALNPPIHQPPDIERPDDEPFCYSETFHQPDADIEKKVDLLFVVDTSSSLNPERKQIGDGIEAFIEEMPTDVDLNIGVMLGHVGDRSGKLYRKESGNPLVLKSTELSKEDIRTILRYRMEKVISESVSDGGEAGLYSLDQALETNNLLEAQEAGFFRDTAALAVVFVADENDICARYPDGVTRVYDRQKKELPAFDTYCGDVTPESVLDKLQSFYVTRPLLVAGILYNELSVVPSGGENEIGYGYLETVRLAKGLLVDLSGNHLHEGLAEIGQLTSKKIELQTDFKLQDKNINPESIKVEVDGDPVDFDFDPDIPSITLTDYAGMENSEVYISYCEPEIKDPIRISDFRLLNVTHFSATFSWKTDVPASSMLEGVNLVTNETHESAFDPTLKTEHTMTIYDLDADSFYSIRAISKDKDSTTASNPLAIRTRKPPINL